MPIIVVDFFSAIYLLQENPKKRESSHYAKNKNFLDFLDDLSKAAGEVWQRFELHICYSPAIAEKEKQQNFIERYTALERGRFANYFIGHKFIPLQVAAGGAEFLCVEAIKHGLGKKIMPEQVVCISTDKDLIDATTKRSPIQFLPLPKSGELNSLQLKNFYAAVEKHKLKKEPLSAYLCSDIDDTAFKRAETFQSKRLVESVETCDLVLNTELVEFIKKNRFSRKMLFTSRIDPFYQVQQSLNELQQDFGLEPLTPKSFSAKVPEYLPPEGTDQAEGVKLINNFFDRVKKISAEIEIIDVEESTAPISVENILAALNKEGCDFSGHYYTNYAKTKCHKIGFIEDLLIRPERTQLRNCLMVLIDDTETERFTAEKQVERFKAEYGITLIVIQAHLAGQYHVETVADSVKILSGVCAAAKKPESKTPYSKILQHISSAEHALSLSAPPRMHADSVSMSLQSSDLYAQQEIRRGKRKRESGRDCVASLQLFSPPSHKLARSGGSDSAAVDLQLYHSVPFAGR